MDESGRMVVEEDEVDNAQTDPTATVGKNKNGTNRQPDGTNYYMESLTGEGAFKRLPDGRIKFVNKRKRDEEVAVGEDDDGEDVAGDANRKPLAGFSKMGSSRNVKRRPAGLDQASKDRMTGKQYRAKVICHLYLFFVIMANYIYFLLLFLYYYPIYDYDYDMLYYTTQLIITK